MNKIRFIYIITASFLIGCTNEYKIKLIGKVNNNEISSNVKIKFINMATRSQPLENYQINGDRSEYFESNAVLHIIPMCVGITVEEKEVDRYCRVYHSRKKPYVVYRNIFTNKLISKKIHGRLGKYNIILDSIVFDAENYKIDTTILKFDSLVIEYKGSSNGKYKFEIIDHSASASRFHWWIIKTDEHGGGRILSKEITLAPKVNTEMLKSGFEIIFDVESKRGGWTVDRRIVIDN